jgi:hypothetical protein
VLDQTREAPLRRLTRAEYDNTVRDLLGDTSRPARSFLSDEAVSGFEDNATAPVTDLQVELYFTAAEELAQTAVETKLDALLGCDAGETTCVRAFIESFGRRARVGSIQLGNSGGAAGTPNWPEEDVNVDVEEHELAHLYAQGAGYVAQREALETFYTRQFRYLLQRLDSVEEADGTTLLDNTLVLWAKNISHNHSEKPMLFMLAGGGGAYGLETNRYHSFPDQPHNRLLVSICQLVGEGGLADVDAFGDPDHGKGSLSI